MTPPLRIALFTDSFNEANGVATLTREFAAFAERRQLPFLCVHSGAQTQAIHRQCITMLELKRSRAAFALDYDLYCDPLLSRYKNWVTAQVRLFRPDLVHITGPGDMGILGFWVAHSIGLPLVASWHTNLHEYAARRLDKVFSALPSRLRERISKTAEKQSLSALLRFYRMARFLLAPNQRTVQLLNEKTGKPTFLMPHGVDTELYSPCHRGHSPGPFCIGYAGRLTPEKNVRTFAELECRLRAAGQNNFSFLVVGEGSEKEWLRSNLRFGELPGVLRGDALAQAFANMDVFVFPSRTDTFGLVLLEAMASGVPVVVTPETAIRLGVRDGTTGFHAEDLNALSEAILHLMKSESLRREMSSAARRFAGSKTWCAAFEQLYSTYQAGLKEIRGK